MTRQFSITYEKVLWLVDDEEPEIENGFVIEKGSLRDALSEFDCGFVEPSSCPVDWTNDRLWFTESGESQPRLNYHTGETETRSFHLDPNLTPSTRRRIARLLGYDR